MGKNCAVGQLVVDEPSCRDAALQLGRTYVSGAYDRSKWPAGCFIVSSVFFNPETDHSSTFPHSDAAGICKSEGLVVNHIIIKSFSLGIIK